MKVQRQTNTWTTKKERHYLGRQTDVQTNRKEIQR
jgi:hypothetical protein